jgi:hypothetical protein
MENFKPDKKKDSLIEEALNDLYNVENTLSKIEDLPDFTIDITNIRIELRKYFTKNYPAFTK